MNDYNWIDGQELGGPFLDGCGPTANMTEILVIALAFFCGSLPLSVWLGRVALGKDITQYGDGNPGAANVWRAGGGRWGMLAVLLDFLKGAIPVGLANFVLGLEGWQLAAVAIAPILGHAFSPFMGFHGGKALAVTFGIWTGLSLFVVPIILGLFFAFYLFLLKPEGWAVMAGIASLLIALLIFFQDPVWLATWAGMTLILAWKHRTDLRQKPHLRSLGRAG
ncbi:MAG: glycerol-3-phosphate acyltransferase [Chloroflexota bacterium]|nr:MAG: glycerol-3-phosphate acyltransferase [Chloroflexota bacterium]